eukprot:Protomagalhaensia_sp_Gyna_25__1365@NODE_1688_length_1622_cov_417_094125_g1382_i0_p2_GENE_NODE_1688_length_1622_cov_417_094125_g1382_i0NODE_1688_length_1622_cov_417_094125_g1382_i0_p2_ORF_typecomplete_len228_score55_70Cytidylate_kin/PF02224_18/2_2e68Cytidylate_kin2/PF13189_6/4_8e07AAA_33/PF13671_6/5e06AAA_17/PF13207_6/0_00012AAA_17/PF13207_6/7_4e03PRK/PF00485_18/0_0036PRK/PF00485_18/37AAA_18/PF13238_6/0_00028ADK/PF00406_22/0_00019ADK/PF00406_22/3_2e03dNK/PF01712_19/0_00066AAA_28/PF13521_6/0_021IP
MATPVITVDGPSGAGKGTLCQALAAEFGWHLLDSGAIYRVLALCALRRQVDLSEEALVPLALALDLEFRPLGEGQLGVFLEGIEVGADIRNEDVGNSASKLAALPAVRTALLQRQRDFRKAPGLVADGRDMGSVVFPDAPVKIFLEASAEIRAHRRVLQLKALGQPVPPLETVLEDIRARDDRDRNRSVAPLIPAPGALVLDSTELSVGQMIRTAIDYIQVQLPQLG